VVPPVVTPSSADPCRKSSRKRVVLAVLLIIAALGGLVYTLEQESKIGLVIGLVPLVLVALVCLCDPCGKSTDSQD